MNASWAWGSLCLGMVLGWVTYYTMRKNTEPRALSDITVIISALLGPAILAVFPAPTADTTQTMFGFYGIGLAVGFFLYYAIFMLLIWKAPRRLLITMGLVQRRTRKPADASGAGTPTPPTDIGIMHPEGESPWDEE